MRVISILLCLVASALAFSPHPFQTSTPRGQTSLQMDAGSMLPVGIMLAAMAASIAKAPTDEDAVSLVDAMALTTGTVAVATVPTSLSVSAAVETSPSPVAAVEEEEAPKSRKGVRVLKKLVAPWRKWENIH